jgi:hypothetical protein
MSWHRLLDISVNTVYRDRMVDGTLILFSSCKVQLFHLYRQLIHCLAATKPKNRPSSFRGLIPAVFSLIKEVDEIFDKEDEMLRDRDEKGLQKWISQRREEIRFKKEVTRLVAFPARLRLIQHRRIGVSTNSALFRFGGYWARVGQIETGEASKVSCVLEPCLICTNDAG